MERIFADLHSHPVAWSFNALRNTPQEKEPILFTPWNIPESNVKRQAKGKRVGYSQADFAKLLVGRTKLIFASLYPIEKGFFRDKFFRVLRAKKGIRTGKKHTLLDMAQTKFMGISKERVEFFQGKEIEGEIYDYWDELQKEYDFYLKGANKVNEVCVDTWENGQRVQYKTKGSYQIAKTPADVTESVNSPDQVAVVLTIEGMHALGIGNPDVAQDIPLHLLKERIAALKGESKTIPNWEHPVFFITFAHHFDNTLCGHAHSFPNIANKCFLDQSKNLEAGFNSKGLEIAKDMLGLDEQLKDTGSRRILLDVKHMSPQARADYYQHIVEPYNSSADVKKKLPIVASHVGYSGAQTLEQLIEESHLEKTKGLFGKYNRSDNFERDDFYAWGINLCDQDIEQIHKSEGLLGLAFDQRILGVRKKERRENNIDAFTRTIERIVLVPFKADLDNPAAIWDTISIGTDFEGYIDPLDPYPTAMEFKNFAEDLKGGLYQLKKRSPFLFGDLEVEEIIQKISFGNAYQFLIKHFEFGFGQRMNQVKQSGNIVS